MKRINTFQLNRGADKMKTAFMDKVCTVLLKEYNFSPVIDNNGNRIQYERMRIVQKVLNGKFILVELLDADYMSKDQITNKLEVNRSNLEKMGDPSVFAFQVFIFSSEPDNEKLQLIKEGQMEDVYLKKYLPCISIDLQNREVKKLYDLPIQTEGLENALNVTLESDFDNLEPVIDNSTGTDTQDVAENAVPTNFLAKVPYVTYCLLIINIVIWLIMNIYSRFQHVDVSYLFIPFGAKDNFSIMAGEYWRFITPIFLHADLKHLLANSLSLFIFGRLVEGIYGHKKFAFIYLSAGVIGNIVSFIFSTSSGVGASGSIFGLFGALLYLAVEMPSVFKKYFGNSIIIMIIFNLAYGFSNPGIDNFAHVGGMIGGFLTSGIVKIKSLENKLLSRPVFITATLLVVIAGLYYGFNNNRNIEYYKAEYNFEKFMQLTEEDKWAEAEELGEKIIEMKLIRDDTEWKVLYNVSVAEAYQNKYEEAIETAKILKDINAAKGHFLIGVLYLDTQQYELAREELKEAAKLNPENKEQIDQFLEQIEKELR
ncbi:MAG: Rhomboid protease GluP [Firmicutes bacterium ADurb.Bin419]|nr:MAG: Rhomboid protease GluP [Firmicutes bacterium ADurb.Bin419]